MWIWCHPAVVEELTRDVHSSLLNLDCCKPNDLARYFSQCSDIARFSLRGVRSQRILSQVFWPQFLPSCSKSSDTDLLANLHSIFLKLLQSDGVDAVWKDKYVLNIKVVDVRHLSIRRDPCESVMHPDPGKPWVLISKEEWEDRISGSQLAG